LESTGRKSVTPPRSAVNTKASIVAIVAAQMGGVRWLEDVTTGMGKVLWRQAEPDKLFRAVPSIDRLFSWTSTWYVDG